MKKKLFKTVLISCGLFLFVGESALAAPPVSGGSCGLKAYNDKINQNLEEIDKLNKQVSADANVGNDRQAVIIGDASQKMVVSKGALAAGASVLASVVILGDEQQNRSYQDVITNLKEADHLSSRQLSKLSDDDSNLYYTTHVINKYYKSSDPVFTPADVGDAIKGLVRSGALCHEDGTLATGGEFRDLIVKERRKQLAAALEKAGKSAEARRARASTAPGSDHDSSKVDRVKPDSHVSSVPVNLKVDADANAGN